MTNGARFLSFLFVLAIAAPAMAQTAEVLVIPNTPAPAASTVDVYLDGTLAVPNFGFRTAAVVDLPAGSEIEIGIAPGTGTTVGDVIATFPFTLTAGERYVVMATGLVDTGLASNPDGIDVGFTLLPYTPWETMASSGNVGLLLYHGAPDAPAVDAIARNVGPLFENQAFKEFSDGYLEVPAGEYTIDVAPTGGQPIAAFSAPLTGLDGAAAVVFASGFLGSTPGFGLFAALPNGDVIELPSTQVVSNEASSFGSLKAGFQN